jgi:putative Mg2+ transporter-C (MgtC) family protein
MHVHFLAQRFFFERLAIAMALGLIIGFERQWRQKTAGLHTSTLVATGAALFTMVPALVGNDDTMRVAAQIVTGVGFLAGGVILRDGFNVRGLITAATLWATAAVGVLVGQGLLFEASVGAVSITLLNLFCVPLAGLIARIPRASTQHETVYTLRSSCIQAMGSVVRDRIIRQMETTSITLVSMSTSSPREGTIEITAEMTKPGRDNDAAAQLQAAILGLGDVTQVTVEMTERST